MPSVAVLSPAIHKRMRDIDSRSESWREARSLRHSMAASLRRSDASSAALTKSSYIPAHLSADDLQLAKDTFTEQQRAKFEAWRAEEAKRLSSSRRQTGAFTRVIQSVLHPFKKRTPLARSVRVEDPDESSTDDTNCNVQVRPLLKAYSPRLRSAQRAVERAKYDEEAEKRRQARLAEKRRMEDEKKRQEDEEWRQECQRHAFKARKFVDNPGYKYEAPKHVKPYMLPETPKFHTTSYDRRRQAQAAAEPAGRQPAARGPSARASGEGRQEN